MLQAVDPLEWIQGKLSFRDWGADEYPQFSSLKGLGRVATVAVILGIIWGAFSLLGILLAAEFVSEHGVLPPRWLDWVEGPRSSMLGQWCIYMVALSTFHLLEFFMTAAYNPSAVTADSFLVNHSKAYTGAALASWSEFWLRFWVVPHWNSTSLAVIGGMVVLVSQILRSLAMATAGESFNHLIQTKRNDNHVLVTCGIYSVLRHPSYVGFFYWSIGTQLLLGNVVHALVFSVVSWSFFKRRIAYEEESLCLLFPDQYPSYVAKTWIGIPFLKTQVSLPKKD